LLLDLSSSLVLDTSVVLNLLATGVSESVLASLGCTPYVCSAVADQTLYIRAAEEGQPREPVSVDPWLRSEVARRIAPESEAEQAFYVRFAADLDDGEAMSLAICHSRSYSLATDDRKARRMAAALKPRPVRLVSTGQTLRNWAGAVVAPDPEVKRVLNAIERRARFIPPGDDPSYEWWMEKRG
jgi:predicted nucleic acid-binding protein